MRSDVKCEAVTINGVIRHYKEVAEVDYQVAGL